MNDLLNKFKAMDTSQKLLVIGVAICILTFPFYLMSGDEETANSEFDSFETPDNRNEIQDYNSKLEAYDAKREKSDNVSLEFNLDDYKNDDALGDSDEELMEREIDSLMNENKRQYSGRAKSSPRSQVSRSSNGGHRPSSSTQTDNSSQSNENVDSDFQNFGEAYFSTIDQGKIKGWKKHHQMIMNLVVPHGKIKFVIFDDRPNSSTNNQYFEIVLSPENYQRLTVPPNVWMGFQGIASHRSLLLNIASILHDPDESESCYLNKIPYSW